MHWCQAHVPGRRLKPAAAVDDVHSAAAAVVHAQVPAAVVVCVDCAAAAVVPALPCCCRKQQPTCCSLCRESPVSAITKNYQYGSYTYRFIMQYLCKYCTVIICLTTTDDATNWL